MTEELPHYREISPFQRDWILFWAFIKITALVVGGGYAIIAAAQAEFSSRRKWISEDDIIEMITVVQSVPGILACNSAIFIGWKINRLRGALAALVGAVLPSLLVIMVIAAGMSVLPVNNVHIQGAFLGVISAIVGMVLVTALKLRKRSVSGWFGYLMAAVCFVGLAVFEVRPQYLIIVAIAAGILRYRKTAQGRKGAIRS